MPPVPVAVAPALPDKHGLFSGNPSRRQPVRPPRWQIQASLFPVPANTWRDYLHGWNQTNRARSQNRHMPGHPYRGSAPLPLALTMPLSGVLSINPYLGTAPTSQKHPVQTYILVLKTIDKEEEERSRQYRSPACKYRLHPAKEAATLVRIHLPALPVHPSRRKC